MSIEVNWDQLTGGPDGEALAETIRAFIHERFQQVTLPKFIRSVQVHSFDFGSVAPQIDIKDVCDPLPEFYDSSDSDDNDDDDDDGGGDDGGPSEKRRPHDDDVERRKRDPKQDRHAAAEHASSNPSQPAGSARSAAVAAAFERRPSVETPNPFVPRMSTPGIPGGTSNMSYFHMPFSSGLSGTSTPFANHFPPAWPADVAGYLSRQSSFGHRDGAASGHAFGGPAATPANSFAHPSSSSSHFYSQPSLLPIAEPDAQPEVTPNDVQIVARVRYSGDVKMSLTADILLDYPMQSFVGIPLLLNVTGMTFDGVALLAYIRKKAHFCFLAAEDAEALVGGEADEEDDGQPEAASTATEGPADGRESSPTAPQSRAQPWRSVTETMHSQTSPAAKKKPVGGLFEEIRVESEIGQKSAGKTVLKNVGKVENFVLAQVRRIFESEFVYPSFWTFLV